MIFVAEYDLSWEHLETAMAKRLEWDEVRPDSFQFLAEYVWTEGEPPFRGVAIFETDTVEDVNGFVMHYGPTLKMAVHPASDVVSAIAATGMGRPEGAKKKRSSKRKR